MDLIGRRRAAFKFVENCPMRLRQDVGKHVEPAAMGHAERDVLHAKRAAALDDLLERRNHRFRAVQPEPLGASEFEVAELLEPFGLDQLVEDCSLALAGEGDLLVGSLYAFLNPAFLLGIGDMHKFDAERLAVGALENGHDLPQRAEFQPEDAIKEYLAVVVRTAEAVAARIEFLS